MDVDPDSSPAVRAAPERRTKRRTDRRGSVESSGQGGGAAGGAAAGGGAVDRGKAAAQAPTNPEQRVEEQRVSEFVNPDAERAFNKLASLSVLSERFVDLADFPELSPILEKTGLGSHWGIDRQIDSYPHLVRLFYANRSKKKPSPLSVETSVKGKQIKLTAASLGGILGISSAGQHVEAVKYTDTEVLKKMFAVVPERLDKNTNSSHLTPLGKIANIFVKNNLSPTRGAPFYVGTAQIQCMYCMFAGIRCNWAQLIVDRMYSTSDLPYPSTLSRVFQHYQLSLDDLDSAKPGRPVNHAVVEKSKKALIAAAAKRADTSTISPDEAAPPAGDAPPPPPDPTAAAAATSSMAPPPPHHRAPPPPHHGAGSSVPPEATPSLEEIFDMMRAHFSSLGDGIAGVQDTQQEFGSRLDAIESRILSLGDSHIRLIDANVDTQHSIKVIMESVQKLVEDSARFGKRLDDMRTRVAHFELGQNNLLTQVGVMAKDQEQLKEIVAEQQKLLHYIVSHRDTESKQMQLMTLLMRKIEKKMEDYNPTPLDITRVVESGAASSKQGHVPQPPPSAPQ